jgi:hypothetical protein
MFISKLRFYSFAIAAENKELDSHEVVVVPIEVVPDITGEILDSIQELEVSGDSAEGKSYTIRINASSTITATWMPFGSNRVTSPDIKRGERLIIWQYADHDKYYWTPAGLDDSLRRLETVIYAWSATPDHSEELDLDSNMYSLEVSTHKKIISLKTTQADGEPFGYTIELDTAYGKFSITDNEGNTIFLDSPERIIKAKNTDNTEITIDKTKIYSYAKDMMEFKCDGEIKGYVKKKSDITCDGPYIARAPTMQFGMDGDVEPSVLGDSHGDSHKELEDNILNSQVIGNLGIPTSTIRAATPWTVPAMHKGGGDYSKVNKNQ